MSSSVKTNFSLVGTPSLVLLTSKHPIVIGNPHQPYQSSLKIYFVRGNASYLITRTGPKSKCCEAEERGRRNPNPPTQESKESEGFPHAK